MTHAELVKRAERWLRRTCRCGVVLCEVGTFEIPDAIGWRYGGRLSIIVECKASRADFLADKQKPFRKPGDIAAMGDERYFLTVPGIVKVEELPQGWGLLELTGSGIKCRKKAERQSPTSGRKTCEMALLWSELRLYQMAASGCELFPSKRAARIQRDVGR